MKKILICYFSISGVTRLKAKELASKLSADIEEIIPVNPYTKQDLDWNNSKSRTSLEMNNESSRPQILPSKYDVSDYNVIFIGYPIWWDLEPRCIDTYLDSHHLKGKKIILFATSGGSGISNSINHIRSCYNDLNIDDGLLLNFGIDIESIKKLI